MNRWILPALALLAMSCTTTSATLGKPDAMARLEARSGSSVSGLVRLYSEPEGRVRVVVEASGLEPNTTHAFHFHEHGDCSAADATSAGGHFNPSGASHGAPSDPAHHAGDFGNLAADAKGRIYNEIVVDYITLSGERSVVGRAAVLHADPDDLTSQPAGNAGKRIACGVVALAQ